MDSNIPVGSASQTGPPAASRARVVMVVWRNDTTGRGLRDNRTMGDLLMFAIPFGLLVVVPVVAILTTHQRRMAEIIHKNAGREEVDSRILEKLERMQQEIGELRQR